MYTVLTLAIHFLCTDYCTLEGMKKLSVTFHICVLENLYYKENKTQQYYLECQIPSFFGSCLHLQVQFLVVFPLHYKCNALLTPLGYLIVVDESKLFVLVPHIVR